MADLNWANGMSVGATKRLAKFIFGHFYKFVEKDENNWCFNIIVYAERDGVKLVDYFSKDFIEHFKKEWSKEKPGFALVIYKEVGLED